MIYLKAFTLTVAKKNLYNIQQKEPYDYDNKNVVKCLIVN